MRLHERDLHTFNLLQDGPQSSLYLWEQMDGRCKNRFGFLRRLLQLTDLGYLRRPPEVNPADQHTHFKVYDLGATGKEELKQAGLLYTHAVPTTGGYPHMIMAACIVANIKMGEMSSGYTFISQDQILRQAKNLPKFPLTLTTTIDKPFIGSDKKAHHGKLRIIPDQLFGLQYKGGARFFALEADRGTYTLPSLIEKMDGYADILKNNIATEQWGIPNLFPMIVTTSEARMNNIIAEAKKIFPNGSKRMLFNWIPGFQPYEKPPAIFPKLCDSYFRTGEPLHIAWE